MRVRGLAEAVERERDVVLEQLLAPDIEVLDPPLPAAVPENRPEHEGVARTHRDAANAGRARLSLGLGVGPRIVLAQRDAAV